MRNSISAVLAAALLGLSGMAGDARATITISLVWGACGGGTGGCSGTGSSTVILGNRDGGQTLRLDIFLTHDETSGLTGHTFSINFDTDLGNELNLTPGMAPVEWAGTDGNPNPSVTDLYFPFTAGLGGTVESTNAVAGRINSFDSASVTTLLPANGAAYSVGTFTKTAPGSYRVGQVFFTATSNVGFGGADVFAGSFNGLFDISSNGNFDLFPPSPIIYGVAFVHALPEPGTAALLGLGLVGLVLGRRRSRRS